MLPPTPRTNIVHTSYDHGNEQAKFQCQSVCLQIAPVATPMNNPRRDFHNFVGPESLEIIYLCRRTILTCTINRRLPDEAIGTSIIGVHRPHVPNLPDLSS